MISRERKAKVGSRNLQCEAAGCSHSARWDWIALPGHPVALCTACNKVWSKAYEDAFSNWETEFQEAAA